jgi:hypothetical protein
MVCPAGHDRESEPFSLAVPHTDPTGPVPASAAFEGSSESFRSPPQATKGTAHTNHHLDERVIVISFSVSLMPRRSDGPGVHLRITVDPQGEIRTSIEDNGLPQKILKPIIFRRRFARRLSVRRG